MPSIVVVGAHWGDEGKGKIVDMLSQSADMVVRYSGGDNAGHTVINDLGKFGLHLVPSGIFCKQAICIIANGTVINPESLFSELDMLQEKGVDYSSLRISDKAHLTLPYHVLLDGAEEQARGSAAIGTTKRGIGPTYTDKAARRGLRTGDLLDLDAAAPRLQSTYASKAAELKRLGLDLLPFDALMEKLRAYAQRIGPLINTTETLINQALDEGKTVVFEGAQGTLLDVEFGTYPYVTSSTTIAPGVYPGAGLRPRALDHILGVFKAYTTRVGTGPMPTELLDETGDLIRNRAHEFGVTTGRPRRCGWFDAVAGRYSVQVNGMNAGALTRLDVLDDFPSIKVCVAYDVDGKAVREFPGSLTLLNRCTPVYEELPGWRKPTAHLRRFGDLPAEARAYIHRLEHLVGCPMKIISVGPRREETITVSPLV